MKPIKFWKLYSDIYKKNILVEVFIEAGFTVYAYYDSERLFLQNLGTGGYAYV